MRLSICLILYVALMSSCSNQNTSSGNSERVVTDSSDYGIVKITRYYDDGRLRDSSRYEGGKRSGISVFRDSSNGKLTFSHYKNGRLSGPATQYYNGSRVCANGSFENGERVGLWEFFSQNGNIERREYYTNDHELLLALSYENDSVIWSKGSPIDNWSSLSDTIQAGSSFKGTLNTVRWAGMRLKLVILNSDSTFQSVFLPNETSIPFEVSPTGNGTTDIKYILLVDDTIMGWKEEFMGSMRIFIN